MWFTPNARFNELPQFWWIQKTVLLRLCVHDCFSHEFRDLVQSSRFQLIITVHLGLVRFRGLVNVFTNSSNWSKPLYGKARDLFFFCNERLTLMLVVIITKFNEYNVPIHQSSWNQGLFHFLRLFFFSINLKGRHRLFSNEVNFLFLFSCVKNLNPHRNMYCLSLIKE